MNAPATENAVVDMIRSRGEFGRVKYGVSMDRKDLTLSEWITHYQEEMADGLQYAERMKGGAWLLEEAKGLISQMATDHHSKHALAWIEEYDRHFGESAK